MVELEEICQMENHFLPNLSNMEIWGQQNALYEIVAPALWWRFRKPYVTWLTPIFSIYCKVCDTGLRVKEKEKEWENKREKWEREWERNREKERERERGPQNSTTPKLNDPKTQQP